MHRCMSSRRSNRAREAPGRVILGAAADDARHQAAVEISSWAKAAGDQPSSAVFRTLAQVRHERMASSPSAGEADSHRPRLFQLLETAADDGAAARCRGVAGKAGDLWSRPRGARLAASDPTGAWAVALAVDAAMCWKAKAFRSVDLVACASSRWSAVKPSALADRVEEGFRGRGSALSSPP